VIVIVDVLSFSTTITEAVARGATAAVCAPTQASSDVAPLSPSAMAGVAAGEQLVFTSLNGAACVLAASQAPVVLLGCLRNRKAVAAAVLEVRADACTIVACGERWPSIADVADSLRPGIEDWIGAGAIVDELVRLGADPSVEAQAAAALYRACSPPGPWIAGSFSGQELIGLGRQADVDLSAEVDVTDAVPRWAAGAFTRLR